MREKLLRISKQLWKEWRLTLFFFLFVLVPMKSSLADWNWVPTGSMNPTILEGDLVYVNKLAYDLRFPLTLHRLDHWGDPEKGDIVVLFSPEDGTRLVKRVIGTPGDQVEMRDNALLINDRRIEYSPLPQDVIEGVDGNLARHSLFAEENLVGRKHAVMQTPAISGIRRDFERLAVPEGQYFVMGDNRDNSLDSRSFGFAERQLIIGEATSVIASFNILDRYQPRLERFFSDLE